MPTKDRFAPDQFTPDDPLPLFVTEHADEFEQQGIVEVWDKPGFSSRILTMSILVVTAAAIGIAILWMGNPVTLFAEVTASLVDKSPADKPALQPDTDQSTPIIQPTAIQPTAAQSTAEAQALPSTVKDAPTRDEIAAAPVPAAPASVASVPAAPEPAGQSQTENSEQSSEALFKQFQTWAAEKEAHAQAEPVQPAQDAPVQVAQNVQAPVRPMQKHRKVRPEQNARAEIRHVQKPRARVRREQNAQVQVQPVQDARAQAQPAQPAQAPSFLQDLFRTNPPQQQPGQIPSR